MPVMSPVERTFCRNALWSSFARRTILPWALQGVRLSGDVLELGGGSGGMAGGMAQTFPGIRVTTTDVDPAMVEAARRRLDGLAGVEARQADATALPFPDGSFDQVTSFLMLHHVGDWRGALGEAARVLRPGGVLVGYDLTRTTLARLVHWADRSPHRLVAAAQFGPAIEGAGLLRRHLDVSFRGHVVRFVADKPS